jgi:hypothetical protein
MDKENFNGYGWIWVKKNLMDMDIKILPPVPTLPIDNPNLCRLVLVAPTLSFLLMLSVLCLVMSYVYLYIDVINLEH